MPRVSVVIPAYNPGRFLQPALESIQNQTYADWEVVVVDDGSLEDVQSVSRYLPHLKYIKRKHCGQSISRNAGIVESCGEFIALLDHDDVWHPHKLQRQVEAMDRDQNIALCYTSMGARPCLAGNKLASNREHSGMATN